MTTVSITIDLDEFNMWKSYVIKDVRKRIFESEKYPSGTEDQAVKWIKNIKGAKGFLAMLTENTPEREKIFTELTVLQRELEYLDGFEQRAKADKLRNQKPGLTFPEPQMNPDGI